MATPQQARRAADQHADALSAYPNVVGIGTQPVEESSTDPDDGHAVAVYVSRKVASDRLGADERLPTSVEVAGASTAVPVVVVEVGTFDPEADGDAGTADTFTTE